MGRSGIAWVGSSLLGMVGMVRWEEASAAGAGFELVAVVGLEVVAAAVAGAEGVEVVELGDDKAALLEDIRHRLRQPAARRPARFRC